MFPKKKKKKSKSRSTSGGKKMVKKISSTAKIRLRNSMIASPSKVPGNKILIAQNQVKSEKKLLDDYEKSQKIIKMLPGQNKSKSGNSE